MQKPKESLVQFLWTQKKIPSHGLKTVSDKEIEVIDLGQINTLGGPDVFQAKIKIDGTLWIGNVEFHVNSSDWYRHGHQEDPAYRNVILHVVINFDKSVFIQDSELETLVIPPSLIKQYAKKIEGRTEVEQLKGKLPCANLLHTIPDFHLDSWKLNLLIDRWEKKLQEVGSQKDVYNFSWIMIMMAFGVKYNKLPMKMIAQSIDFKELKELPKNELDTIFLKLSQLKMPIAINERNYVQYEIPIETDFELQLDWKFGGIRPMSQPIIKLMQFSSFFSMTKEEMVDLIIDLDIKKIKKRLSEVKIHSYWENHSSYNKKVKNRKVVLGSSFKKHFLINTVFPLSFHLNKNLKNKDVSDEIIQYYENLPKENNRILSFMEENGFKNASSLDSQSLIHLKNNFCEKKKCLNCRIGIQIIQ